MTSLASGGDHVVQQLAVSELEFKYRGAADKTLRSVDLIVRRGEGVGIIGKNGAGKTTALSAIVRSLDGEYGGAVRLQGCADYDIRDIGFATQEPSLYGLLTVRENIEHVAALTLAGRKATAATDDVIDEFGLGHFASRQVRNCSGGQRRLAHLAASFVYQPMLRMLDESTVGLDFETRNRVIELTKAWKKRGCALVVTAHYPEDLQEMCERLVMIREGTTQPLGMMSDLIRNQSPTLVLKAEGAGSRPTIRVQPQGMSIEALGAELLRQAEPSVGYEVAEVSLEDSSLRSVLLSSGDELGGKCDHKTDDHGTASVLEKPSRGRQRTSLPGWATFHAVARTEVRVLKRIKTPFVFMFVVPAALALLLGPAVSAIDRHGAGGRTLLGFGVLFSFMSVNLVGNALYREVWNDTWRRQAFLKPPRVAFTIGKSLPIVTLGLIQLIVLAGLAAAVLHLPISGFLLLLIPIGLVLLIFGSALGVLLYSLTRDLSTFANISYLVLLLGGAAGGTIVASSRLPTFVRSVGYVTPQYWAMRTIDAATYHTASIGSSLLALAIVGLVGSGVFVAAVYCLNYTTDRSGA